MNKYAGMVCLVAALWGVCPPLLSQTEETVASRELSVHYERFIATLDSLIDWDIECSNSEYWLLWVIGVKRMDAGGYRLVFTRTRAVPEDLYGHFYRGTIRILVTGERIDSLFVPGKVMDLTFRLPEELQPPEHHSLWYFNYSEGSLEFDAEASFVFPCRNNSKRQ